MSSNIKLIFILSLFCTGLLQAQDPENEESDFNDDPETVFFNIEIFRPVGLGNSSFAKDYSSKAGFAFDFNWFFLPQVTLGTHFSLFGSSVKDPEKVGNISTTTTYLFGLDVGYYHELDRYWNIHVTAGIGKIENRSKAPGDRFTESGTAYWVQVQVAHRFNSTLAVYLKLSPEIHNLRIEAPQHLDNYFNRHLFLNPGLGLRINFQNPGG